jgi:hypothetical protein
MGKPTPLSDTARVDPSRAGSLPVRPNLPDGKGFLSFRRVLSFPQRAGPYFERRLQLANHQVQIASPIAGTPVSIDEYDALTREGIEWLAFLRSTPLSEEGGGSLASRIILFGQSLDDAPHQDGDICVVNKPLLNEKLK